MAKVDKVKVLSLLPTGKFRVQDAALMDKSVVTPDGSLTEVNSSVIFRRHQPVRFDSIASVTRENIKPIKHLIGVTHGDRYILTEHHGPVAIAYNTKDSPEELKQLSRVLNQTSRVQSTADHGANLLKMQTQAQIMIMVALICCVFGLMLAAALGVMIYQNYKASKEVVEIASAALRFMGV